MNVTDKGHRNTVIVYRDLLLPPFEGYIRDQADALSRYAALFVGTRSVPGSDVLPRVVLGEPHRRWVAEGALKIGRMAPRGWASAIEHQNPALVHAHFGPDAYGAMPLVRRLRLPMIVTFHGYDITMRASTSALHAAWVAVRPLVFRKAARVIAVSQFIRERLIAAGCPASKVIVHYIGVDRTLFHPDPSITRERTVLFVGRLIESKGCSYLIEAMQHVHVQRPDLRLVIVGDGPLRAELEKQALAGRASIEFAGALTPHEVRREMNRALIFCSPSIRAASGAEEALGLALLEAQSMGLPVASTRTGGIPEAVLDGETGILVPEKNANALADAIMQLTGNERAFPEWRERGTSLIATRFDLRVQTQVLEEIYDDVLSERGRK